MVYKASARLAARARRCGFTVRRIAWEDLRRNQQRFAALCQQQWPLLICANTNLQPREWQPYAVMANAAGYRLRLLLIGQPQDESHQALCAARNSHGVSAAAIAAMARRFEP